MFIESMNIHQSGEWPGRRGVRAGTDRGEHGGQCLLHEILLWDSHPVCDADPPLPRSLGISTLPVASGRIQSNG